MRDGSLLSKEVYKYEFDTIGNWVRMTTSVAVVENGKIGFEPTGSHLSNHLLLPRCLDGEDAATTRSLFGAKCRSGSWQRLSGCQFRQCRPRRRFIAGADLISKAQRFAAAAFEFRFAPTVRFQRRIR